MAAGVQIKHKRKAGAFSNGELAAGEWGLDTTNSVWYYSVNGTTVIALSTGTPADLTGITNATANSGYPAGSYAFNALESDGFIVDGSLTGKRSGTTNVQRLHSWTTGLTYSRYWIEATTSWSSWEAYADSGLNHAVSAGLALP